MSDTNLPPCPRCEARAVLKITRRGIRVQCKKRFSTCSKSMSTPNTALEEEAIEAWDALIAEETSESDRDKS